MGILTTIALTGGGVGAGYLFYRVKLQMNKSFWKLYKAMKKGHILSFMEDYNKVYFRTVNPKTNAYQNLAVNDSNEINLVPEGSAKSVVGLPGVQVYHGDFYKGIGSTLELRNFRADMLVRGFTDSQISKMFKEIQQINENDLLRMYKGRQEAEVGNYNPNDKKLKLPEDSIERLKYDIYVQMPSTIKSFIATGINRTMMNEQMNLKIEKDKWRQGKKTAQFMMIGVMVLLILVGFGMALKFGGDTFVNIAQVKAGASTLVTSGAQGGLSLPGQAIAERIAPTVAGG